MAALRFRYAPPTASHGAGSGSALTIITDHSVGAGQIPLAALMRCRFILSRKLREKIAAIRAEVRKGVYQNCLFAPDAKPELSFENGFRFHEGMFAGVPCYRGTKWRFNNHYLGWDRVPAFDGKDDGEEFKAAQQLDSISDVAFWVRNVAKHPDAFWLPLAGGRTYPDFIAKLKDGRLLVVEYKGEHLVADSAAKRAIGELWQNASNGSGIYVFAEKEREGMTVKQQILAAIG